MRSRCACSGRCAARSPRNRPTAAAASITCRSCCSVSSVNADFLLTGDVEEDVDPSLLTGGLPRLDLLKVADHGSRTATTEAFVAAVRPRVAGGVGGNRQPVWPSGAAHAGTPRSLRRAGIPDRCRRVRVGDVRGGGSGYPDGAGRGAAVGSRTAEVARTAIRRDRPPRGPQRTFVCAIPEVRPPASPTILPVAFRGPARGTQARAIYRPPQRATPARSNSLRTAPGAPTWVGRTGSGTVPAAPRIAPDPSVTARTPWLTRPPGRWPEPGTSPAPWSLRARSTPAWSAPERTATRQPSGAAAPTRATGPTRLPSMR